VSAAGEQGGGDRLLAVTDLRVQFGTKKGTVHAVNGVSFSVGRGEMLGIVGESGCGKSATGLSIMRLVPRPGRITSGAILLDNQDLRALGESEMRAIRGKSISMIFQDPMSALNPVLTISRQLTEALILHEGMGRRDAHDRSVELLRKVGIPSPEKRIRDYPHQFSGGMRQRATIAMAISCRPKIIIADEPTTALDVTIQAQIIELMQSICRELGTSIVLITHSLGIVAGTCRRVAVMYAGRIVEQAGTDEMFSNPRHPYTHGLLTSTPRMDRVERRLQPIGGMAPSLRTLPSRCFFAPRCAYAVDRCTREDPALQAVEGRSRGPVQELGSHSTACFRSTEQLW